MSKKQWIWLVVAMVLFIGIGAYTAWQTNRSASQASNMLESLESGFSDFGFDDSFPFEDFIARIDIEGTIMSDSGTVSALAAGGFSESHILDYIDLLIDCPENVGILLYINSGGGEIRASDNIYLKLMDYKNETGRPIYAFIDGTGCSGAYYIAMAADEIYANRNSVCVNIGVYIETYNLAELFEKYGVKEIMIKSSENKGIGAMGQPWTEEQLAIYQSIVDLYYDQFLEVVADGRGMTKQQVMKLDDGREMLASQALEAGFIDGMCRYEEYADQVLGYFDNALLYEEAVEENNMFSLLNYLYGKLADLAPASDSRLLRDFIHEHSDIVVMAYAG